MTIDLKYYLAILISRLHYVLLVFAAVTAAAITLAIKLPPSYESSATLLLAAPQIPNSLVTPTVNTAALEQLQVLQQRLMTRPNLLDIARKLNVFPKLAQMTPDQIVNAMSKATTIDIHTGDQQAALMVVTFSADQAQTAANVVSEYVTRILADNLSTRTNQAQDTQRFFQQQVDRLQGELSNQSAKIVAFQNANTDALPSTLDTRLQEQQTLQEQLGTIEHDIGNLQDEKQRLIDLFRATGQVAGADTAAAVETPEARLLSQAKSELAVALSVYAPDSPKVKMLQSRVNELQAGVKRQAATVAPGSPSTPQPASILDVQTATIDSRIKQLTAQRDDVKKAIAVLKASIDHTPQVAVELDALNRDYSTIQGQYKAASDQLAAAATGERIEADSKGQRVVVLDAPSVPDAPTRPHRIEIAVIGAVAGMMLGLGLVALLEMLNTSVRRPVELVRGLDITPIVAIPYIRTPGERARARVVISGLFLAMVLGLPATLYAVDTYYEPLGLIVAKVNTKLGL